MQALTTLRTVVATVLDEVEDRTLNLIDTVRGSLNEGVDIVFNGIASMVGVAFTLVDAVVTAALGEDQSVQDIGVTVKKEGK